MKVNIVFGGPAGTGPNIVTNLLGKALVGQGYYVFYSRDYQSLIRGGHNFNTLTFSDEPVFSNDSGIDILVAFDKKTIEIHKGSLRSSAYTSGHKNLSRGPKLQSKGAKEAIIIEPAEKGNMYYAGKLFKLLCLDFKILDQELKDLGNRYEENVKDAKEGYEIETKKVCELRSGKSSNGFMNGSQGIAEGALKSEMDIYYAYPMPPATPVLMELGQATLDEKNNLKVVELENEIAVANAGVGSCMVGKKVMVGTSGGGFDLMTETLSLCGIAEIPLVFYLSMRPGPGTGVATYSAQGDLNIARHAGHGEFQRVVLAPGDPKESEELTNQAFYFSHKFKVPSIVVSDKHLGESFYTIEGNAKLEKINVSTKLKRFNSYEVDAEGSATEDPKIIEENIVRRMKKVWEIEAEAKKFEMYSVYGKKNSENVVVFWGSPKGAVLDAIKDLDCTAVQIKYIEPFPKEVLKLLKDKNVILVENNSTGLLADLIREKTGLLIEDKNKILKFNGRAFLGDELKTELEKRI